MNIKTLLPEVSFVYLWFLNYSQLCKFVSPCSDKKIVFKSNVDQLKNTLLYYYMEAMDKNMLGLQTYS